MDIKTAETVTAKMVLSNWKAPNGKARVWATCPLTKWAMLVDISTVINCKNYTPSCSIGPHVLFYKTLFCENSGLKGTSPPTSRKQKENNEINVPKNI